MANYEKMTFGSYIADARKKLQMSQKELATRILREEDGESISPQYINDIERDRRNPTSDHLIQQFAKVLKIDGSLDPAICQGTKNRCRLSPLPSR